MALAPRAPLLSVPSAASSAASTARWSRPSTPTTASRRGPLTLATAVSTPLAQVAVAAVAELDGLVGAGRRAGGHRRPAVGAGREEDLHLDGGVAAGVEDLPPEDVLDVGHGSLQLCRCRRVPACGACAWCAQWGGGYSCCWRDPRRVERQAGRHTRTLGAWASGCVRGRPRPSCRPRSASPCRSRGPTTSAAPWPPCGCSGWSWWASRARAGARPATTAVTAVR